MSDLHPVINNVNRTLIRPAAMEASNAESLKQSVSVTWFAKKKTVKYGRIR